MPPKLKTKKNSHTLLYTQVDDIPEDLDILNNIIQNNDIYFFLDFFGFSFLSKISVLISNSKNSL